MTRTAIILAAGRGSRLDPGGGESDYSKPLIDVGGKSLLQRTVDSCRAAGAERVVVVTGFRAERLAQDVAGYGGGDIELVHNAEWEKPNGLSLYCCREVVRESFALMMSDHIFDPTILRDMMALELPPDSVTLAVDRKLDQIFDMDDATKVVVEDGRIARIHKQLDEFNAVDCGLFACTPAIFDGLGEAMTADGCSLSDGMAVLGRRDKFHAFDIGDRWWQDVDTPDMRDQAVALLARVGAD